VQVVNAKVKAISLNKLAARLKGLGDVTQTKHMLHFVVGEYEITIFPDGRAVIENTIDESVAKELYDTYVRKLV